MIRRWTRVAMGAVVVAAAVAARDAFVLLLLQPWTGVLAVLAAIGVRSFTAQAHVSRGVGSAYRTVAWVAAAVFVTANLVYFWYSGVAFDYMDTVGVAPAPVERAGAWSYNIGAVSLVVLVLLLIFARPPRPRYLPTPAPYEHQGT